LSLQLGSHFRKLRVRTLCLYAGLRQGLLQRLIAHLDTTQVTIWHDYVMRKCSSRVQSAAQQQ
jgi:hypothetical protein